MCFSWARNMSQRHPWLSFFPTLSLDLHRPLASIVCVGLLACLFVVGGCTLHFAGTTEMAAMDRSQKIVQVLPSLWIENSESKELCCASESKQWWRDTRGRRAGAVPPQRHRQLDAIGKPGQHAFLQVHVLPNAATLQVHQYNQEHPEKAVTVVEGPVPEPGQASGQGQGAWPLYAARPSAALPAGHGRGLPAALKTRVATGKAVGTLLCRPPCRACWVPPLRICPDARDTLVTF